MELIHPSVQAYAENFSSPEDMLLKEVNDFTVQEHAESVMLSGPLQGKVLEMISCMIRPRRILEIGTFTGYSALCLAKGLAVDGELHTIELREKDAVQARTFFDKSVYVDQIISHTGNALSIIPEMNEIWDLVNGFILADNIFFHGQVLEENVKGKSAIGIKAFNEFIKERTDIDKVVLTIRDGLYLIRKLN